MPEYKEEIYKIDLRKHARLRPGMYIGGTDARALHNMVFEVLDDAVEEAIWGYCTHIWVTIAPNETVTVRDNGRGIPIEAMADGKSLLEQIMTDLAHRVSGNYQESKSFFGVGALFSVNALSAECTVEVARDNSIWRQSYKEGIPQTGVEKIRPTNEGESTGTTITFRPDFTIMEPNAFDFEKIAQRMRELAYLLPGLTLTLRDERTEPARLEEFHFPNNLADYVRNLNQGRAVLHEPLTGTVEWQVTTRPQQEPILINVKVAIQYTDTSDTMIVSYANTLKTVGGLHVDTLPAAIATFLNKKDYPPKRQLSVEDCLPGLTAVMSVTHSHPLWENQLMDKLLNSDVVSVVYDVVGDILRRYNGYQSVARIHEKCLTNRRALHPDEPEPEDEL